MKKTTEILLVVSLVVILVISLSAVTVGFLDGKVVDKVKLEKRFEIVYQEDVKTEMTREFVKILYDNKTDKYYLIYRYGMNVAMCPMENPVPIKPTEIKEKELK